MEIDNLAEQYISKVNEALLLISVINNILANHDNPDEMINLFKQKYANYVVLKKELKEIITDVEKIEDHTRRLLFSEIQSKYEEDIYNLFYYNLDRFLKINENINVDGNFDRASRLIIVLRYLSERNNLTNLSNYLNSITFDEVNLNSDEIIDQYEDNRKAMYNRLTLDNLYFSLIVSLDRTYDFVGKDTQTIKEKCVELMKQNNFPRFYFDYLE